MSFKPFGSVKVEWPGKADGRHLHHPPKGEVLSVFNIFHTAKKVVAQKAEVSSREPPENVLVTCMWKNITICGSRIQLSCPYIWHCFHLGDKVSRMKKYQYATDRELEKLISTLNL